MKTGKDCTCRRKFIDLVLSLAVLAVDVAAIRERYCAAAVSQQRRRLRSDKFTSGQNFATSQHLDMSRCWALALGCGKFLVQQVVKLLSASPLVVLYNMSVAGVRVVEFGTKAGCAYHRLNGSSSPVLTATLHSNGKGQISTPYKSKTPERIAMKFGTVDYVLEFNPQNKFSDDRSRGSFWVNM